MTELLVLQTDSVDSIYMFNSMLWLFWTLKVCSKHVRQGARGKWHVCVPWKVCLSHPLGCNRVVWPKISVGVWIGWYLHPRNLTWIPKSRSGWWFQIFFTFTPIWGNNPCHVSTTLGFGVRPFQVFIDPFPAEHGSDELREFLAAFGEVDDVAWNRWRRRDGRRKWLQDVSGF